MEVIGALHPALQNQQGQTLPQERKRQEASFLFTKKIERFLETFKNRFSKMAAKPPDEYDYFGMSAAEHIRNQPTAFSRAKAKKNIQDGLFNLDFPSGKP